MRVAEVFTTIQGEGPSLGRPASFIRLSSCNLNCQWCDSSFTWDWRGQNGTEYDQDAESTQMGADALVDWAERQSPDLVVVTGGEPLFWRDETAALVVGLTRTKDVEIETNGTLAPRLSTAGNPRVHFNVSPKLANSGVSLGARRRPDALRTLAATGRATWKFVVTGAEDIDEIEEIVALVDARPRDVWLMPEGVSAVGQLDALPWVTKTAIARGWNVTPRLHVMIWGNKRGH